MTVPAVQEAQEAEEWMAGMLSPIGLVLRDPNLPYEDFERICFVLGKLHQSVRFAIGDALLKGPEMYGDIAYQAFEALALSEDARKEYLRVSEQVPMSVRRKELSWSHHRAVAALEPPEQREWLDRAIRQDLSHHALREALREGEPPADPTVCRCCKRPL